MSTTEKKLESNRQILTRLREFLQKSSNEFETYIDQVRVMFFKLDISQKNSSRNNLHVEENSSRDDSNRETSSSSDLYEETSSSNDFSSSRDCEPDVIVDE